jgi:hypothetical protein
MVEITIVGKAELLLRATGKVNLDRQAEHIVARARQVKLSVVHKATLAVSGQVIVTFDGTGAFIKDGVRVVVNGYATVNDLGNGQVHAGGKGIVFAEGCCVRADQDNTMIAVNCDAHVHDKATLFAVDCRSVDAFGESKTFATGCGNVMVVEQGELDASDCGEVRVDEGFEGHRPSVHTSRCRAIIPVEHSFGLDDDGCVEQIYVDVEQRQAA